MSMLASSLCVDVYNLLSKSLATSMWLHKIYACFGTFQAKCLLSVLMLKLISHLFLLLKSFSFYSWDGN